MTSKRKKMKFVAHHTGFFQSQVGQGATLRGYVVVTRMNEETGWSVLPDHHLRKERISGRSVHQVGGID
jgi:hypothetical protein